jgi:uncharacterized protein YciI
MHIIDLKYKVAFHEIEPYVEEHRKHLQKYYDLGHFLVSGPKEPKIGGIIIALTDDPKILQEAIENDPFYIKNLAEYSLIKFNAVRNLEILNSVLKK